MKAIFILSRQAGKWCSLLIIGACISNNGPEVFNINQASNLLALDTGKVWQRISRSVDGEEVTLNDCELNHVYSFDIIDSSDTLFYIGSPANCSEVRFDTLARWSWRVLGNVREEFTDSVELTDNNGNLSYRIIRNISGNNLEWEYEENGQPMRENFTWVRNPTF